MALISVLATVVGAGIGYFLKYYLDKKKELTSEVTKERRQMYQKFADLIFDMIYESKAGRKKNAMNEISAFFKKSTMYASPNVMTAISELFQKLYENDAKGISDAKSTILGFAKVLKEMRTDLGLSNKGLGKNGENLFKPMLKDWSEIMEK